MQISLRKIRILYEEEYGEMPADLSYNRALARLIRDLGEYTVQQRAAALTAWAF